MESRKKKTSFPSNIINDKLLVFIASVSGQVLSCSVYPTNWFPAPLQAKITEKTKQDYSYLTMSEI
ncbi:hypothetical protein CDAR_115391 [Caerostris darwini]|uniref:Uncharacterized protein n=1 Tax=Caerostris darwini TaxID=1538125 RepID=A0AAV4U9Y2_9ARAC|nr:hypothetical protein CDAR_115391 [Caerostris darwini]